MAKKRKLDYIISESDDRRVIFRFYPRKSSCHSFGEEPPKTWNQVYKVYYSYSILYQAKWNSDTWNITETLFEEGCDECSEISTVAHYCKEISNGNDSVVVTDDRHRERRIEFLNNEVFPMGMGTSWVMNRCNDWINFNVWNYDDKGYRFAIKETELGLFGEYLESCCEYMLKHGDPI